MVTCNVDRTSASFSETIRVSGVLSNPDNYAVPSVTAPDGRFCGVTRISNAAAYVPGGTGFYTFYVTISNNSIEIRNVFGNEEFCSLSSLPPGNYVISVIERNSSDAYVGSCSKEVTVGVSISCNINPSTAEYGRGENVFFGGQTIPNEPIDIFINNIVVQRVYSDGSGNWGYLANVDNLYNNGDLREGTNTFKAQLYNFRDVSCSQNFTLTMPPVGPVISLVSFNLDTYTAMLGDSVNCNATLNNTGDQTGQAAVTFYADGIAFHATTVSIAPGETRTVTAVYVTNSTNYPSGPGQHNICVDFVQL